VSGEVTAPPRGGKGTLAGPLSAVLAVAAVVLLGFIVHARSDGQVETLDAAQSRPLVRAPYATEHTVKLPGIEVSVRVAEPLGSIDGALVRDRDHPDAESWVAPDDGRLVPVSWRARSTGADPGPIDIYLAAGGERVSLDTIRFDGSTTAATRLTSAVVAFADDLDLADITAEVEYDGLTQTLHPATGEIEAGVAQALYEPLPELESNCAGSKRGCPVAAADEDSALQIDGSVESRVRFQAYDSELGWAEKGTLWAEVDVSLESGDHVEDAAGNYFVIWDSPPMTVTLDGARPSRSQGFDHPDLLTVHGVAVFPVAVDTPPQELRLRYTLNLSGEPGQLAVSATMPLASAE